MNPTIRSACDCYFSCGFQGDSGLTHQRSQDDNKSCPQEIRLKHGSETSMTTAAPAESKTLTVFRIPCKETFPIYTP